MTREIKCLRNQQSYIQVSAHHLPQVAPLNIINDHPENKEKKIIKVNLQDDKFLNNRIFCEDCPEKVQKQLVDYDKVYEFLVQEKLNSEFLDKQLTSLKTNIQRLKKALLFQLDYMIKLIDGIRSEKREIQINQNLLKDFIHDSEVNYRNIHDLFQDVSSKVIITNGEIKLKNQYYSDFEFHTLTKLKECCEFYEKVVIDVAVKTLIKPPAFELHQIQVPVPLQQIEEKVKEENFHNENPGLNVQQINDVAYNRDILCISCFENGKNILKFKQNEVIRELQCDKRVTQIQLAEDNSIFCIEDQILKFYKYQNSRWDPLQNFSKKPVKCYAIHKKLIAIGDKEITLGKVNPDRNLQWDDIITFRSKSETTCLQFNEVGNKLIAGCQDGLLIIYEENEEFWQFKQQIQKHMFPIKYLTFHKEQEFISACGNEILIWPLKNDHYIFAYQIEQKHHHLVSYFKNQLMIGYENQVKILEINDYTTTTKYIAKGKIRFAQLNQNKIIVRNSQSINERQNQ